MSSKAPVNVALILGLAATGVVVGLLTCLVGLPAWIEFSTWMSAYVIWVIAVVRVEPRYPILDVVLGSLGSGVAVATTQILLYDHYFANNFAAQPELPGKDGFAAAAFPFALGMGLVFGLIVGGVAEGVVRFRRKRAGEAQSV